MKYPLPKKSKENDNSEQELAELKKKLERYTDSEAITNAINKLIDEARNKTCPKNISSSAACPYCRGYHMGCTPRVKIKKNKILYGIQCRGVLIPRFFEQGQILIPKHLRKYL